MNNEKLREIFGFEDEINMLDDPDTNQKVYFKKLKQNAENTSILKETDDDILKQLVDNPKTEEISQLDKKTLINKYNTDFVMLQGLEELKYKIKIDPSVAKDPFIDIFEKLNDEDRLMIEQVTLQKALKNGSICNKEFQSMAEDAFSIYNDLII